MSCEGEARLLLPYNGASDDSKQRTALRVRAAASIPFERCMVHRSMRQCMPVTGVARTNSAETVSAPPTNYEMIFSRHRITYGGVEMAESIPIADDDARRAIQALSEKLDVPELKVLEVYKTEYHRLSAQSRIATFVSVLAMRNTRSILRDSGQVN
jgi:hypothetical protein